MAHFKGGHKFQPGKKRRVSREAKARTDMATSEQWTKLMEEHEIAYLRGDLATSSPQSYTLDEKRQICEQMEASTADIDAALRADFWSMPADARSRMLDLLGTSGCETRQWWEELLGVVR